MSSILMSRKGNLSTLRHDVRFTILESGEISDVAEEKVSPTIVQILTSLCLVSGTTVGAGILAVASVSLKPGFFYSSIAMVSCWVLMSCVGFVIAEITCNIAARDRTAKDFGIISITDRILGSQVSRIIGILYVAFHYTLLMAYISKAGGILSDVMGVPGRVGPVVFTVVVGGFIVIAPGETVSMLNNGMFALVVLTFLGLVGIGISSIKTINLHYHDIEAVGPTIPIFLVALVFHNIVPTVCSDLKYHRQSICTAILAGSLIPLLMFILWNAVILGLVPDYDESAHSDTLIDPVQLLLSENPTHDRAFGQMLVTMFSEAAVITSFIGFVIALMEYYADIFPGRSKQDPLLYALVLIPPMLFTLGDPGVFLAALDAAGAYGISVLFGLLPVVLAIHLRKDYRQEFSTIFQTRMDQQESAYFSNTSTTTISPSAGSIILSISTHNSTSDDSSDESVFSPIPLQIELNSLAGDVPTAIATSAITSKQQLNKVQFNEHNLCKSSGSSIIHKSQCTNSERRERNSGEQEEKEELEDPPSTHSEGIELSVMEQQSLVSNQSIHGNIRNSDINNEVYSRSSSSSSSSSSSASRGEDSVHGTGGVDHVPEYMFFLPGGDPVVYILGVMFIAIIIVKIASNSGG